MKTNQPLPHLHQKLLYLNAQKQAPLRVAIVGMQGAGKTTFAREFTEFLLNENEIEVEGGIRECCLQPVHVKIDDFHHPKAHRYRQGRDSAKGYYEDAYNEQAFVEKVLKLSQMEPYSYIPEVHDLDNDQSLNPDPIPLTSNSVLLVDGAFLLKPIYAPHWDFTILIKTDFETAMERGIERDAELLGGVEMARQKYLDRYHKAYRMYVEEVDVEGVVDFVVGGV